MIWNSDCLLNNFLCRSDEIDGIRWNMIIFISLEIFKCLYVINRRNITDMLTFIETIDPTGYIFSIYIKAKHNLVRWNFSILLWNWINCILKMYKITGRFWWKNYSTMTKSFNFWLYFYIFLSLGYKVVFWAIMTLWHIEVSFMSEVLELRLLLSDWLLVLRKIY